MGDFEKFYNKALEFLSYRPRSEKEVRDKLKTKKVELEVIDRIISKLKEKKFINDEEFTKGWTESRLRFKPRSVRLIKLELKQKGIDPETINNLQLTIDNDLESARKLVEKKIGRLEGLPKQEIYQKLGRYLASKGFDWDTIKKSIDAVLDKGV
ncbi:MAG: Regulatory protein RecX [Candidatus Levybacteria bacterium GW2011_GWA2_37_36]|nr:MAG: Regulatory protein RecX [Candidatus Levybacteria bacterium GW2011_GWA1_37_16]KKQ32018.1 MAG: Regulatory protein RecX [Candidatus Levybacteria bacterium GW2011_GWA2_37_36]